MIEVQVAGQEQLAHAETVLRESIKDASGIAASPTESMLRFRSAQVDSALSATLKRLIDAGVQVIQFREVAGNLEEAFLSVTREGNTDSEPLIPIANAEGEQ